MDRRLRWIYGCTVEPRAFIDGVAAPDGFDRIAAAARGHFTAMQVRDGAVRGWDLHIARLTAANREMFDAGLDAAALRAAIRQALGDTADASVRVVVFPEASAVRVAVTVRLPFVAELTPQALLPVAYWRPLAHLKRIANPGHGAAIDTAIAAGFDDAVLVDDAGEIAEGGITNIGFWDGTHLVWPAAPALAGITYQLIAPEVPSRHEAVFLRDVPDFRAAVVTNSHGIAAVRQIGAVAVAVDEELLDKVRAVYDAAPWTVI